MVGISQLFPLWFSFNQWVVFFWLAGRNAWKSKWLHSMVLGWRKWFTNQSRAKLQAEEMALLFKCLPCMHEDPGLGFLNPNRKLGGCGGLSTACSAGK